MRGSVLVLSMQTSTSMVTSSQMAKISDFLSGSRGIPLQRGFEGILVGFHTLCYINIQPGRFVIVFGRLISTKLHTKCVIKTVFRDLFIFIGFRALRREEVRLRQPVILEPYKNIKKHLKFPHLCLLHGLLSL